ncbi:MAG: response regulator [Jaaginema sp. PMC 1079.18]|nr:response regulator [Jaaginema sp. PMC 1080.18]MEC4851005.1 response regulator [Jaaginema sp. PMC 1079.18]MEC4869048.1 response regulator [Jaaginema sp. PMC 1078.18]
MERRKKPKMLVVDDEPDNLDLLYRTFRRDFRVYKADSGINALEILQKEGEVAVIISDQRMPEMKGTEFLSQTVPQFPDTVRIILTGFTDVEDLVEAINSGQVYKYITKPWDPNELKGVVEHAAETYDLLKQRTEELQRSHLQTLLMAEIVMIAQTADSVAVGLDGLAVAIGKSFKTEGCVVQLVKENAIAPMSGQYQTEGFTTLTLEGDPLATEAIATQKMQVWVNGTSTPAPPGAEHYGEAGVQLHLVAPILYRDRVQAVLSLQWQKPSPPPENELQLIHLTAQQVALPLKLLEAH